MRAPRVPKLASIVRFAAMLALSACSGNDARIDATAAPPVPAGLSRESATQNDPAANILYVAESRRNVVAAYEGYGHGKKLGEFKVESPYGVFTDSSGNIWVADSAHDRVVEFEHGTHRRLRTLHDVARPLYVVVGQSGTVYVSQNNSSEVAVFEPNGKRSNRHTIGVQTAGMCLDAHENLYVVDRNSNSTGGIMKFPYGSPDGKNLGIYLEDPEGLAVDSAGNVIVAWQSLGIIKVYPPNSTNQSAYYRFYAATEISLDEGRGTIAISEHGRGVALTKYPFEDKPRRFLLSTPFPEGAALEHGI